MVGQVLASLEVRPGGAYIDCTVGEGGHAAAIMSAAAPGPRLLGIDPDGEALATARRRLKDHGGSVTLTEGNYADLRELAHRLDFIPADGVLFDFGISSLQLETRRKGFQLLARGTLGHAFRPEPAANGPPSGKRIHRETASRRNLSIWRGATRSPAGKGGPGGPVPSRQPPSWPT